MGALYLEDLSPGTIVEAGPITVTTDEAIAFARQFDPQPFHTDPETAKSSMFGGLALSGWHTAALTMKMLTESALAKIANGLVGIEVRHLKWPRPARPGGHSLPDGWGAGNQTLPLPARLGHRHPELDHPQPTGRSGPGAGKRRLGRTTPPVPSVGLGELGMGLVGDLKALGVRHGDLLMVHASLRALGLARSQGVDRGAELLLAALTEAVGPKGTLLMILGTEYPRDWVNPTLGIAYPVGTSHMAPVVGISSCETRPAI